MLFHYTLIFIKGEELYLFTLTHVYTLGVKESDFKPTKIHRPKNALITGSEIKGTY